MPYNENVAITVVRKYKWYFRIKTEPNNKNAKITIDHKRSLYYRVWQIIKMYNCYWTYRYMYAINANSYYKQWKCRNYNLLLVTIIENLIENVANKEKETDKIEYRTAITLIRK